MSARFVCPHCGASFRIVSEIPKPKKVKESTVNTSIGYMAMFSALMKVTKLEPKLNGWRIGNSAKQLLDAGFTAEQVVVSYDDTEESWWNHNWRGHNKDGSRATPTLNAIAMTIKEAVTYGSDARYVEVKG